MSNSWRNQKFLIRAEDLTGQAEFVEVELPLEHILKIVDILYKQKRNVLIGRNFLQLLMSSNPQALSILEGLGFTEFKRVKEK